MKKINVGLFILLTAALLTAKPAIKFKTTTIDFGSVDSGKIVEISFEFENTGSDLLVIKNIVASCGCTTAELAKKEYKAGEKGVIPVRFNSSGYNGKVVKTITVTTNDPDAPENRLTLSGTMLIKDFAQAEVKPDRITIENAKIGKSYTRKVNLSNSGTIDLRIIESSSNPEVSLLFSTSVVGPKKSTEIGLTFTPFVKGAFHNLIKIRTNDYRNPYIFIRLEAQID